jgi:phospholipase/carboxylesterase
LSIVPVKSDTAIVTFEDWTLRIRRATLQPARLLLMIHGWTGDENSMWVFVRDLPTNYCMLAPRAPHGAPSGGYSWRAPSDGHRRPATIDDLRPSAAALIALVDAYGAQNALDTTQLDVMGFSQGAVLTNALSLLYPQRLRRAVVLAGFMPAGAERLIEEHPLQGKPFFVAHGTLDEMVSIEDARRSVKLLERAGAPVTFCEDDVGHKVSASCLRAMQAFLLG